VKVVFLEEVEGSGRIGEVRNVADGFARNYLLPRKLAVPATEHNMRIAEARAQAEVKRQAKLDAEAQVLVERMVGKSISMTVKAGPQGRLYGSVTSRDIAEELGRLIRAEVDHRQVELEEPIREVGVFEVPIRFTQNVRSSVEVTVVGEGEEAPASEGEEAPTVEEAKEAPALESEDALATEEEPAAEVGTEETAEESEE
jgi:large subunit ribosomal protein L9